ncbi:MAG: DUF4492 domain-containing protein [Paludibacter sp.]|nr:DUF4492 domain-containing protein [Paludibacter sp.]
MQTPKIIQNLYVFYRDGFRNMTVGKTLWLIILIKLFIMFVVLRIFFFPNYLNTNFHDNKSKADHVRGELIGRQISD